MSMAISALVLESHVQTSKLFFDELKDNGFISGDFDDDTWGYQGLKLHFTEIGGPSSRLTPPKALSTTAGLIARVYIISLIRGRQSGELAVGRLNALRYLAGEFGENDFLWREMPTALLDKLVNQLKSTFKITTAYHRATGLRAFVQYMNNMHTRIERVDHRYCNRLINWRHGIPNPIRSKLALTAVDNDERRSELYDETLHIAVAKAAAKIRAAPANEPIPGYDRIRIETLAFALAMGLRVGELCALQKDALYLDTDTQQYGLRVSTEKGGPAGINAIAQIWGPILKTAFDYLTVACSEARQRAGDIERRGFAFILEKLQLHRQHKPLSTAREKQLTSINLDPSSHFFCDELTESFNISKKSFQSGGYYRDSIVLLPQEVSAKVAIWLDHRFEEWDWATYASYYASSGYRLTFDTLIQCSGIAKSPLTKARWFVDDLRNLLDEMKSADIFAPDRVPSLSEMASWQKRWSELKEKILGNRGGKFIAIEIGSFISTLKADYARYLSAHFREEFSEEGNNTTGKYYGNNIRPGMQAELSEHLIVVWQHQFNGRGEIGILPRPLLRSDLYNYLSDKGGKQTVFERLSILDERNQPYSISPHQIRRWLTTALLRSGPNEAAIDLWMGRQPRQTRHYDYRTAKERAEYVREQYINNNEPPDDFIGRKVNIWRNEGISDSDVEKMVCEKLKALHYTPWGTCSRELYVSPCDKGLMCLRGFGTSAACESFQIDPTDLQAHKSITELKEKYSTMLAAITNNKNELSTTIGNELNTAEPLDQHILFILDILKGCDAALRVYIPHANLE